MFTILLLLFIEIKEKILYIQKFYIFDFFLKATYKS
jgi:hypothetical protein